ncbi:hypothetical protein BDU57DRAFT_117560 [Ampelomyces quisqualis]|uniref:Uncharacterized protein n=1 Tax=Ampelomyces quisqualis TaxID=50730 RepID=A0A6A5QT75_AMPQU|nr:hypothetical protein BDU57DRAFT_117560 [Ampelomyces quisqualis]
MDPIRLVHRVDFLNQGRHRNFDFASRLRSPSRFEEYFVLTGRIVLLSFVFSAILWELTLYRHVWSRCDVHNADAAQAIRGGASQDGGFRRGFCMARQSRKLGVEVPSMPAFLVGEVGFLLP